MKVFVWNRIGQLIVNPHHPSGGVVVFAETIERAREIASQQEGCCISGDEKPNDVRDVVGGTESVYYFPDEGCCVW